MHGSSKCLTKTFFSKPITIIQVKEAIDSFKNKQGKHIYNLIVDTIKTSKNLIIYPHTETFNHCIDAITLPDALKSILTIQP